MFPGEATLVVTAPPSWSAEVLTQVQLLMANNGSASLSLRSMTYGFRALAFLVKDHLSELKRLRLASYE